MIKIRLVRVGAKNNPFYRIIAIESKLKRGGKPLEILGFWYPEKKELEVKRQKYENWLTKGAQPSPAVLKLIKE